MTSDPIINQVDKEFSLQLTKLIKNYVIDLVNHEVDVITDSDWFSSKIDSALIAMNLDREDSKNVWLILTQPSICVG